MSAKTYEDGLKAAMEKIDNLRMSEAGNFEDPKCNGQRGQDRSDALYDAYQIVRAMLPASSTAAPPPQCLHCEVFLLLKQRQDRGELLIVEQIITSLAEVIGELLGGAPADEYRETLIKSVELVIRARAMKSMAVNSGAGAGAADVGPSGKAN